MLSEAAFISHSNFFQDPSGSGVSLEEPRMNSVQLQDFKTVHNDSLCRLGAITAVPIRGPNPIAEFAVLILSVESKSYPAN